MICTTRYNESSKNQGNFMISTLRCRSGILNNKIFSFSSFKENAQRISRLLSDRPRSPAHEAVDWVEYTLRHGGLAHLRPYSSQLAWYQYFLVDVVLFLVLIFFVVILLIKYTVRLVCWLCCRSGDKKVKTR